MKEHTTPAEVKAFGTKWQTNYKTGQKLSIFLGLVGANQFYVGDVWLGLLKLILTLSIQGIPISATWWIVDIFLTARHKNDWNDFITAKQIKRDERAVNRQHAKTARKEAEAIRAERRANGLCIKCGSDKIQAIVETSSRTVLGDSGGRISFLPGVLPTHEKVQSKTRRMCLKCGYKFY